MKQPMLPPQFSDLEPLVEEWALARQADRAQKRVLSNAAEMHPFYDTMLPRMGDILAYLKQFPVEALPDRC
jgi:hypothetical protein